MEGRIPSQFAQATARLKQRVDRTLVQCQRFETMCEPLAEWAHHWSSETLARWLHLEHLPLDEREKALVALALKGSEEAGAVLDAYQPSTHDPDHQLFYQVARIEWEQRHAHRRLPPKRRAAS